MMDQHRAKVVAALAALGAVALALGDLTAPFLDEQRMLVVLDALVEQPQVRRPPFLEAIFV